MRGAAKGEGAVGVAGFFEIVDSVGLESERRRLREENAGVLVSTLVVDGDGDEAGGFWNVGAARDEAGGGGERLRRGSLRRRADGLDGDGCGGAWPGHRASTRGRRWRAAAGWRAFSA